MIDPNWLLSTVVQSAAAFVAIVAGFIISRLLALSAERGGLQTRVRDLNLQLTNKKENIDVLEKCLLDWDAEDFLDDSDVLDMIIKSGGDISLTEAINRVTGYNRSEEELRPYWDEAITVTKNAFKLITEKLTEFLIDSENFDILLKNLGLNLSSYRRKIYHRIFEPYLMEFKKLQTPFGLLTNLSAMVRMPDFEIASEVNSYNVLKRDIETIEQDINALEAQLSDLKIQMKQLGQPKGVTLGVFFLAYFSLTGIVIPVSLLPFDHNLFTPTIKWIIFFLFFSGLIFFFIYIIILIRQLTKSAGSDN